MNTDELYENLRVGNYTENGIIYSVMNDREITADITLHPSPEHNEADIQNARAEIEEGFDSVSVYVQRVDKYPPQLEIEYSPYRREMAFRKIVANWTIDFIENCPVDAYSASAVVAVLDNLSKEIKMKLLDRPASEVVRLVWKFYSAT